MAVIRTLPQLQKLDNIAIHPEELSDALKKGKLLCHPEEQQDKSEEYEQTPQYTQPPYEPYYQSPDRSPPRQEVHIFI